jgi:hypothetical protein
MENPLRVWRRDHELSVNQLALLADLSASIVYGTESGERYRLHPRILHAVASVDGPEAADLLVQRYAEWRSAESVKLLHYLNSNRAVR